MLQQSDDDKSSSNGHMSVSNHDDNVPATSSVVQPSTVDATMPMILKYPRESEEKPADVESVKDDVQTPDDLLMTCEFCGTVINPDFIPLHDKEHNSDSEEVSRTLNVSAFTFYEQDDDIGGYCCHDYKLFIELTTNYMQKMVEALQSEQAKRIDVKPGKKLMKKAAEEQAQARLLWAYYGSGLSTV